MRDRLELYENDNSVDIPRFSWWENRAEGHRRIFRFNLEKTAWISISWQGLKSVLNNGIFVTLTVQHITRIGIWREVTPHHMVLFRGQNNNIISILSASLCGEGAVCEIIIWNTAHCTFKIYRKYCDITETDIMITLLLWHTCPLWGTVRRYCSSRIR